jgi:hypothetical protein
MRPPSVPAEAEQGGDLLPSGQGDARAIAGAWPWRLFGYFRSLWRGEFPLSRVFWFDMMAVGTVVNAVLFVATIALFAADTPIAVTLVAFLLHIPYSVILFVGVQRSAARAPSLLSAVAQFAALIWLAFAIVI